MELSCVAGGVHQNERFGRQFGRYETVAKLAATKLAVQNKQCSGCAINSASGFEFIKFYPTRNAARFRPVASKNLAAD